MYNIDDRFEVLKAYEIYDVIISIIHFCTNPFWWARMAHDRTTL